ncbi:MAG: type I-B CRISPR-associated protein Cas7/Cst2/DevR [Melioribacteraceae bacterium]|nr:type I-B CRISPR-associated protein Cas7/Cst2/DevR [Melioribacteraceae bacterium]
MTKNIIGFVLIDAPHSALNNAGANPSERTENTIAVKAIHKGKDLYPYVSAQAWRYWWRNTLAEKFNWVLSPITRETKIALTAANPFKYKDDDLFGYMRAVKKSEGGTLTRLSPLKTSPLISVSPQKPTNDFGVMARHEGDPVPYEHQFYSVILKGIFALDLTNIGLFSQLSKTGFLNLTPEYVNSSLTDSVTESQAALEGSEYKLHDNERLSRIQDAIKALPFLSGGAKQALHHTDVTPKFIILAEIEGGNNIFMNIASSDKSSIINSAAIKEVLSDYKEIIKGKVYIGLHEGFLPGLMDELQNLKNDLSNVIEIEISSPKQAAENFAENITL